MSVQDADKILAQDLRFETELITLHGRKLRAWVHAPKHMRDLFDLTSDWADNEYLVEGDRRATFGDFRRAVYHCSGMLREYGVEPGDRVALLMRNRIEWPVAFFSAMLAGAIIVPINGWETPALVEIMLRKTEARYLISDGQNGSFNGIAAHWSDSGSDNPLSDVIPPSEFWPALPDAMADFAVPAPDATGAIFFTSGTSGMPKGATLSHRAMAAVVKNSEYQRARYALRYPAATTAPVERPTALFPVPLFHVTAAIAGLVGATAIGAKMVLMNRWTPEEGLQLIEQERVTLLGGVPTLPLQLLGHQGRSKYDISSLKDCLYGGAPAPSSLPGEIATCLQARSATGWGMTETASTFLLNSGEDYLERRASCGLVVPLVNEARIVDNGGSPLPPGEAGELQVRGLTVTQGYWGDTCATRASFTEDGWFRTGDIASMDEDGFVTITDRIKDVIIRGGENIHSIEIEDILSSHPHVAEAAVFGRAHPTLGEEVVAAIVSAGNSSPDIDELRDHLRTRLARHKIPVTIFTLAAALPRNAAGKVLKDEVKRMTGVTAPLHQPCDAA